MTDHVEPVVGDGQVVDRRLLVRNEEGDRPRQVVFVRRVPGKVRQLRVTFTPGGNTSGVAGTKPKGGYRERSTH